MPSSVLKLAFVGDVAPYWGYGPVLGDGDSAALIDQKVQDLFQSQHAVIGNFEGVMAPGSGQMQIPPAYLPGIVQAGLTHLSLANNHSMDEGPEALLATRDRLEALGAETFGAGTTLAEALTARIFEREGWRIALIGACDDRRCHAGVNHAGIGPMDADLLTGAIQSVRASADLIVLMLHADLEFRTHPAPWRRTLTHRLVEAGADLVIQHHPHVLQGVEKIGDAVAAYSLGNFLFRVTGDGYVDQYDGVRDGLILCVEAKWSDDGVELHNEMVPTRLEEPDDRVTIASGEEAERIRTFIAEVSQDWDAKSVQRRIWRQSCVREARYVGRQIRNALRGKQFGFVVNRLKRLFADPCERRWLVGLITCGWR